jgi:hypothetical protein
MLFIRQTICVLLLTCSLANVAGANPSLTAIDLRSIQQMEDSLNTTADSMYSAFLPDTRIAYSERFARQLVRALKVNNSWSYEFPKLAKRINILASGDGAFKLFNWDIAPTEDTRRYYGAIQLPSATLRLFGLVDYSQQLGKGAEDSIFTNGKWLGALYYRIIPEEIDGKKIYTLFGLNATARLSNKKILEPLQITDQGPIFGAPIFNVVSESNPNSRVNRFILEFKKDVQVAMNWDTERSNIYFDNLVSQVNDPARKYTYVPSGQIDGFKWDGRSWNYVQDIVSIVPRKDGEAPINEPR